jgi:tRNA(His) guanylyltransferase
MEEYTVDAVATTFTSLNINQNPSADLINTDSDKIIDSEFKSLGDRMKEYEAKFTKPLRKPFDILFVTAMGQTAGDLLLEFNAKTVYTHSDEITVIFDKACTEEQFLDEKERKCHIYNGRAQKLLSHLAAFCSVRFNYHAVALMADQVDIYPARFIENVKEFRQTFDARILTFDKNPAEIVCHLIWRSVYDACRNAISTYGRQVFSHKELNNKNSTEMIEMMKHKGVDWNEIPLYLKHGIYCKKQKYEKLAEDGTTCIRTKPIWKTFKIAFSPKMIETMLSSYWTDTDELGYNEDISDLF